MIEEATVPNEQTVESERTRRITLFKVTNAGLYHPCSHCGTASADGYSTLTLVMALNGAVKIDPNPTHACVSSR